MGNFSTVTLGFFFALGLLVFGCDDSASSDTVTPEQETENEEEVAAVTDASVEQSLSDASAENNSDSDISESVSDTESQPTEPVKMINFTGIARYWVSDTPGVGCTVCLHGTNNCATVSETGIFNLKIPANTEVIFTYTGGNTQPTSFSFVSGGEDTVGQTLFVLPERPAVDFMLNLAGVEGGFDITQSIMTIHAGPETFPSGRGMPGITVTIDGPSPDATAFYMVSAASSTGVDVAGEEVTATTSVGHAFYANITPGDYLVTFNDSENQNRICTPRWGWPATEEGLPKNTFRVTMLEGFAGYASVRCETTDTITANGTLADFETGEAIEGANICVSWQTEESGPFDNEECGTTGPDGTIAHSTLVGDHQYLVEVSSEGSMKTLVTLEGYTDDITWNGFLSSFTAIESFAATGGIATTPTDGHVIVQVVNENLEPLEGYTATLLNTSFSPKYISDWAVAEQASSTTADGTAVFFNVTPNEDYDMVVERKDDSPFFCSVSEGAWGTDLGYAAPVRASTITQLIVVCLEP